MSANDPERLEEERRLAYVGITRAMEKLTISYAETRRIHGSESYNRVSRFVKEIPSECLQEVRLKTQIQRPAHYNTVTQQTLHTDKSEDFYLGQRVSHAVFGKGIVAHFEGRGNSARVQVNFESEGSKWLVLQYANLTKV